MENEKELTPRQPSKRPTTIEELQQWYEDRHLPPARVTRFFIGQNISEPRAFGIYRNERGECVLYKNKANGERAVRYQGPDEAYAVGELLERLKDEIANQRAHNMARRQPTGASTYTDSYPSGASYASQPKKKRKGCLFGAIIAVVMAILSPFLSDSVPNGYYRYNDDYYYLQGTTWYLFNAMSNDWSKTNSLDEVITKDNVDQYRIDDFNGGLRFEDTNWYEEYHSSSSSDDDDSGYDWDDSSDSWDSDDSDWDSDW